MKTAEEKEKGGVGLRRRRENSPRKNSGQADGTLPNPPTREADPEHPTNGQAAAAVAPR